MHIVVVRNIITIVFQGGRIKRQQPNRVDAKIFQVIQLMYQSLQIADPVGIAVEKGTYMKLVKYRILEPKWIGINPVRADVYMFDSWISSLNK